MYDTIKAIRHQSFHQKEDIMKKTGLLFVSFLLFGGLMSGCEEVKDATDITFTITKSEVFTLDEDNLTTVSSNVDLNDDSDYARYSGNIRDIEIDYLRYQITSNTGGGGTADFYANTYGGSFATARKVAGPINFAAGELRRRHGCRMDRQGLHRKPFSRRAADCLGCSSGYERTPYNTGRA